MSVYIDISYIYDYVEKLYRTHLCRLLYTIQMLNCVHMRIFFYLLCNAICLKELYTSGTTLSEMINWTPLSNELRGKIRFGPPPPWKSWKKLLSVRFLEGPVRFLEGPVRRLEGPVRRLEGPVRFLEGPALFGRSRAFWKVLCAKWRIRWSLSWTDRASDSWAPDLTFAKVEPL